MAEARTEDEEENLRDARMDQVVRRQPRPNSTGGRPDRHKPEHRYSHGPLSSIRAVIKRTSTRSTSLGERDRDRRRPEITILSAEPLASISGFPGASGGIPPPPPPSAQIWGPTIPPNDPSLVQPPPSYEEVIREKSQEQVLLPPPSSSSLCSISKTTIATQTDTGSAPKLRPAPPKPVKPARPSFPCTPEPSHVDDITASTGQSTLASLSDSLGASAHAEAERTLHTHSSINTHSSTDTHSSTHAHPSTNTSPLSSTSGAQTDQWEPSSAAEVVAVATPPPDPSPAIAPPERPRPRPRSKPCLRPISREVKVQTLVKLREDGLATLAAARKGRDLTKQEESQGKYLQELLEAFSSDDWGFPDHRSDGSGHSQSDSEEEEQEDEEMGTLKARILAFEQQQQSADVGCGDGNHGDRGAASEVNEEVAVPKRPEPRPRPRLQGQLPSKPAPPTVAPKPKPPGKGLLEEGGSPSSGSDSGVTETPKATDASTLNLDSAPQLLTDSACSSTPNPEPVLAPESPKTSEKPSVLPSKPPPPGETLPSNVPAPVPAPRPPPPKAIPSPSDNSSNPSITPSHRPPPRPTVAPRASVGATNREKSTVAGPVSPALPPRTSVEVGGDAGDGAESQADAQRPGSNAETTNTSNIQAVKTGSGRPVLPVKPPTLTMPRRASAPSLAPKPFGPPPDPVAPKTPPTTQTGPPKPTTGPTKPPAPTSSPVPSKPPAPTVAQRKTPAVAQTKAAESSPPARPAGAKFLPLRPPPIKNIPGRPPPPTVTSTSSSTTNPVPPSKSSSTPPPSPAEQPPPPIKESPAPSPTPSNQTPPPSKDRPDSSPTPSNQTQGQKTLKRGPPLPPRPKPGHALFSSYGKQEVLVVLDDPSPAPSEPILSEGSSPNTGTPLIDQSQCLLDLEIQPDPPLPEQKDQSKMAPESLSLLESQSILPEQPAGLKQQPDTTPESGPRCVAKFDYEGEEEDELTFSQGDVISLLELIGEEWARGQIHGRIGIFPLNFTEVVEPLPLQTPSPGETTNDAPTQEEAGPAVCQEKTSEIEELAIAVFDFPGQTAGDLSFHKGALISVIQHIDAEWRRGRVDGKEGLYPVAFTQPYNAQPVVGQQSEIRGVAKALFDFTAECDDELTLKVGDVLTEVVPVDEKWIMGVVGGRRGIVPKNYISLQ